MARFRHISTKLVLVLDAGTENGKKTTKRVTISGIKEDASTNALWELAQALGKLLEYPVAEVRLYKVEAVEREDTDGATDESGGVDKEAGIQKEADTNMDMARVGGGYAFPAFASRSGTYMPAGYSRHAEHSKQTAYGKHTGHSKQAVCGRQAARLGGHTPALASLLEKETPKIRPSPPRRKK